MDIGKLGEDIACKFLERKGFQVKLRNYRKIFGEIDIVAEKQGTLRFVEVKTLSRHTTPNPHAEGDETGGEDNTREPSFAKATAGKPEDAVHYRKRERLKRAIKGYLRENNVSDETEWQFDILAIEINREKKGARVRFLENMVL